jgi:DNA polymerase III alpha subunit (gram-positive type)
MRYVAGVETDRLSSLINPLAIIPPEVESLTGITPEMVKDAPHAAEVLRQFVQFITQDGHHPILCGHNIMFDLGFLVEKLQSFGISQEPKTLLNLSSALDTLTLAKKLIHLPSYEGIAVGGFLGVINHQAHRAEADVIMAAGILYKLFERLPFWQGHYNTLTLQDILAFQGPLKTRL